MWIWLDGVGGGWKGFVMSWLCENGVFLRREFERVSERKEGGTMLLLEGNCGGEVTSEEEDDEVSGRRLRVYRRRLMILSRFGVFTTPGESGDR